VLAAKEVIDYISKIQSKIEGLGIKTEWLYRKEVWKAANNIDYNPDLKEVA
jgi:hypothetical protein